MHKKTLFYGHLKHFDISQIATHHTTGKQTNCSALFGKIFHDTLKFVKWQHQHNQLKIRFFYLPPRISKIIFQEALKFVTNCINAPLKQ